MARREETLVAQIEKDALDDSVPVATALRKCVVLGGKSGSEELRDWATRELQGYHGQDTLPDYRIIAAPLMVDGVAGNTQVTHQQIPPSSLPDFAHEHISETLELRDGVGSLEALAQQEQIKLSPSKAADLTRIMNSESGPYQHIISLYWSVSPSAIQGVLDRVRTALTQLVAELRANMAMPEEVPTAAAADHAVQVVVTGERSQVKVTTAQADALGAVALADASERDSHTPSEAVFWTRWRKVGAFLVGLATIAGAVAGILQLT
jgi:AbiTii-like protein